MTTNIYIVVRQDWEGAIPMFSFTSQAEAEKCVEYKIAHTKVDPPYGWYAIDLIVQDKWVEPA